MNFIALVFNIIPMYNTTNSSGNLNLVDAEHLESLIDFFYFFLLLHSIVSLAYDKKFVNEH